MTDLEILIVAGLMTFAYITIVWLLSLRLKNAGVIDIAWGLGFVLLAALYFGLTDGFLGRKILILTLVGIWGLRLSGYLFWRTWGEVEDFRYRELRERRGGQFWWQSYFVFLGQGFGGLFLVSMALLAAQAEREPDHLTWLDAVGTSLWLCGFLFETLGDWQLARFRADPSNHGKVMSRGLWRYTRHPNYFGDAVLWWGLYLIAAATPGGWVTVFSPLLMTWILMRVSGVRTMEPHLKQGKPGYADYVARTSSFVPWFAAREAYGRTASGQAGERRAVDDP